MLIDKNKAISEAQRRYYMTVRQTLLMQLAAIEEMLGLERSVPSKWQKP